MDHKNECSQSDKRHLNSRPRWLLFILFKHYALLYIWVASKNTFKMSPRTLLFVKY